MGNLLEIGMFKDFQRDPELFMKKLYLRLIIAYENESFLPQRYRLVLFSLESMSLIRKGYRTHADYPLLYFLAFFTHVSKSLEALRKLYIGCINVHDPNAHDRQYNWKVRITQITLDTFAISKIPLEINEIMTFLSKSFGNDWNSVVTNQALYANQLQKKLHGNFVITIEERENLEKKFKPVAMVVVEQKEFPTPIAFNHYLVTINHNSTHDLHKYKERRMGQLLIQAATRLRIDEEAWNWAMRLSGINPWDLYTAILFLGWTGSIILLKTFFMMRGTRTMAMLIHTIMDLICQNQQISRPFLLCVCEQI